MFRRVWAGKKGKTIKFDQLQGIKSKLDKKEYVSKSTIFCLASLNKNLTKSCSHTCHAHWNVSSKLCPSHNFALIWPGLGACASTLLYRLLGSAQLKNQILISGQNFPKMNLKRSMKNAKVLGFQGILKFKIKIFCNSVIEIWAANCVQATTLS